MTVHSLTLTRGGTFRVPLTADQATRCGPPGDASIRYHVVCVADPARLNSSGMVIDHNRIQDYFDTVYASATTLPSCEQMAIRACEDLSRLIGCGVIRLEVTVGGTPQSGLTAYWTVDRGACLDSPPNA
jgi:hypothetical protein